MFPVCRLTAIIINTEVTMNNRKYPRKDIVLKAKITYPSGLSQVVNTRDISEGGAFLVIEKSSQPTIGELVTIDLMDEPKHSEVLPSSDAVVVRQELEGIGLSFIEMDFEIGSDF